MIEFADRAFANSLQRTCMLHSFSREFTANASGWFSVGMSLKRKTLEVFEVPIQNLDVLRPKQAVPRNSETFEMLLKAQSGAIPVVALEKTKLERNEVALFLARELLFLRSVADSAKLSMLAILLDELHLSLLDSAKGKVKPE